MDQAIAALAERQHGLITTAQLARIGLDTAALTKRARAGRLRRVYRAVYSVGPLSRDAELMAVALLGGPDTLISHWAGAELLDLTRRRAPLIDALVPSKRQSPPGTKFHRATIDPRDRTDRRGIPVTTVARLIVDLTDVVTVPHEITAVIREAAFKGLYSLLATQDAIERNLGRKIRTAREAIELYESGSAGTRSREEVKAITLLKAAGLPEPLVNTRLLGEEVDFHWPARKLVIELDGPGHSRAPIRRDDARRDRLLRDAGWTIERVSEPEDVVQRLLARAV
ncbi:type IV toxin-antitoxin system AbiEi family antitoxin domain-containing protein [Solirubrobacter sp. CPCC 204708]|uniref:Type IV toxin-antitoxin system AbiEi family antitoxin domain-containing protein n=1 Tax=Solirubrobacter deserti TaxID=2282478 RepID=A0ABT4RKA6_9ACTN|nr:type IV toxin-antitoxin system AbiEi family antitoxin domain-containing protein [Solirubrobacter deserti]MBE2316814.1 type IV toxin-antitoxin system AbiEi family antitoxin domain-containing protein [Solirubrobacter deserti]MDA0138969.1 type IV toxin-antitoxin system AbiEi family antitoxin domain-containing protein [Solirubrobacter deserti]